MLKKTHILAPACAALPAYAPKPGTTALFGGGAVPVLASRLRAKR